MFIRLLALFILVPCIEMVLLFTIGSRIGAVNTVAVILLTGFVGAWLARQQGWAAWVRIHEAMRQGRLPTREIVDGVLILAAGLLLLTPGFLTDAVGFALLIPFCRAAIRGALTGYFRGKVRTTVVMGGREGKPADDGGPAEPAGDSRIIDVEATRVETVDERPGDV